MTPPSSLGPLLLGALALADELGSHVDKNSSAFNRSVLFIVFAVAVALSWSGFLFGLSPSDGIDTGGAAWVYLSLAFLTAMSLGAYERLPAFRSCAFAVATTALGASFVILDFRTRLGWLIVAGTLFAAGPLIVLEVLRAYARREKLGADGYIDTTHAIATRPTASGGVK